MKRDRRRAGVPIAIVVAGSALLGMLPTPALAAAHGPVLATGRLQASDGAAIAGTVGAWFADANGLVMVASAAAGADGSFSLRAASTGAMRRAAGRNDGWLNLIVAGGSADRQGSVAITRRLQDGAWIGRHGSLQVDITADAALTPAQRGEVGRFASAVSGSAAGTAVQSLTYLSCYPDREETWRGYTVIGEVHTWTDHTATWSYGKTADSDIGVGISYNGTAWQQSGTFHVGTSSSSTVAKAAGSLYGRLLLSRFEYRKLHWTGYCPFLPVYTITPVRWLSGLVEGADVRQYDGYCGSYYAANAAEFGPNTRWSRNRSDYATFGGAVTAFGLVKLTAQSGLSTDVQVTHTFGSGKSHRLCGNDGDILHAHRVFAG
jgi:hypothetical protein